MAGGNRLQRRLRGPGAGPGRALLLAAALAACGARPGAGGEANRRAAMVELGVDPVTVEVAVEPAARAAVDALAAGQAGGRRVVLELHDVPMLGETYQVYLNLPPGERPHHQSLHYVGNVAVYGPPGHRQTLQYDVTETVRALAARGAWSSARVRVTFVPSLVEMPPGVPRPPEERGTRGSIGRVTISAF